ncbi:MAG: hypothetical protein ACYDIA_19500 [Candidatus Humimicrobiaceae bacterium]
MSKEARKALSIFDNVTQKQVLAGIKKVSKRSFGFFKIRKPLKMFKKVLRIYQREKYQGLTLINYRSMFCLKYFLLMRQNPVSCLKNNHFPDLSKMVI